MKIEIECSCSPQTISCINKMNLLKAIAFREIKNHEIYIRHGLHLDSTHKDNNVLEDVSVYVSPIHCGDFKYSEDKTCKYGCTE